LVPHVLPARYSHVEIQIRWATIDDPTAFHA
jgi:hypothetical protein